MRRSVGEFMVSLPLARPRNELRKSLILLARPTRFELVTFAFRGQNADGGVGIVTGVIAARRRFDVMVPAQAATPIAKDSGFRSGLPKG